MREVSKTGVIPLNYHVDCRILFGFLCGDADYEFVLRERKAWVVNQSGVTSG